MSTIDQDDVEFVEYEGYRYKMNSKPHLNVVINRSQDNLRRQMQGQRDSAQQKSSETLTPISEKFIAALPQNSIIAVLNISADNKDAAVFARDVRDEIEYRLVESGKFRIVDRKSLNEVQDERNFQMSGEVSDESAVSLGNMLGANIVINGNISGAEGSRRLTLKALNVETAEIMSTARETL
jgi:TolB-like protein